MLQMYGPSWRRSKACTASEMRTLKEGCFIFQAQITLSGNQCLIFFFSMVSHWKKKQLTNEKHYSDEIILKR